MTKQKRVIMIALACFAAAVGGNVYQGIGNQQLNVQNQELTKKVEMYEESYSPMYEYFSSLSIADFATKVDAGEDFIAYIGRPDCGDCISFEPSFIELIKEKKLAGKLEYVNVKWLRDESEEKLQAFKDKYGFTQTPGFIHFKDGKNISMIEWNTQKGLSQKELIKWLEENQVL